MTKNDEKYVLQDSFLEGFQSAFDLLDMATEIRYYTRVVFLIEKIIHDLEKTGPNLNLSCDRQHLATELRLALDGIENVNGELKHD